MQLGLILNRLRFHLVQGVRFVLESGRWRRQLSRVAAMTPSSNSAALAFDAIAPQFDARFGAWGSVVAQRRAVRTALLREFPAGGKILELGGGTGEDAAFLAAQQFQVLLTDPSPAMVSLAHKKIAPLGSSAEILAAEDMEDFADRKLAAGPDLSDLFDGAFSNFAPLNCVADLRPVARGLARMLSPERRRCSCSLALLSRRNDHGTVAGPPSKYFPAFPARQCGCAACRPGLYRGLSPAC